MCDFIFEHRERQRKKHFCLLRCLSAFATPIKLYFRCVFKLLPYVALAFCFLRFFLQDEIRQALARLLPAIKSSVTDLRFEQKKASVLTAFQML